MRNLISAVAIGMSLILFSGCASDNVMSQDSMRKKVNTVSVTNEKKPVTMTYLGVTVPEDMKTYAFKSPGRIGEVLVEEGDRIEVGDVLVTLDTTDLDFQLEAAKWQMKTAEAQYEQVLEGASAEEVRIMELSQELAYEASQLASDQADKVKVLFEQGFVSEVEYKQALLNAVNSQTSLSQAEQQLTQARKGASSEALDMAAFQYELAKVQYESAESLLDDAYIVATEAGVVVDVPYQAETLIDAGRPVVISRLDQSYIQLGVTQKDVISLNVGDVAKVHYNGEVFDGTVDFIDEFADRKTGTFLVELTPIEGSAFTMPFGSICEVVFEQDMEEGIWIPLTSVLNEGIDYVYLNQDGHVVKRRIDRMGIRENLVLVSGLEEGELVIIEGTLSINEGDLVEDLGGTDDE